MARRSQNQGESIQTAWQFAQTAYNAELDRISREYQEKLGAKRNELAARGTILSGNAVMETARIDGERITLLLQKRLQFLLEGCELYGVPLDDQISTRIVDEIMQYRETMLGNADRAFAADPVFTQFPNVGYRGLLDQRIDISASSIKIAIDRKRLGKAPLPVASVGEYLRAFGANWLTAMSGGLSVPFVAAALYVSSHWQKALLGCLAVLSAGAASYRVWREERLSPSRRR